MFVDSLMQATRVVTGLGVGLGRLTGTSDVNWVIKFDAKVFWNLAKLSGMAHIAGQASPKWEKRSSMVLLN